VSEEITGATAQRPAFAGPPDGVEIRIARSEEYDRIGHLTASVYIAGGYMRPEDVYVLKLRNAATRAREAELVVAVQDGEPIGTVTYCAHGSHWAQLTVQGEAEFRMLAVVPTARGLGLGEALVRHCVRRAREDGCTTLRLSTEDIMHAAHRIYRRLGFVRTPERDWSPVTAGLDLLLTYELAL
jgi:ribosomal protein S18 acetylase RimI-like enzyme